MSNLFRQPRAPAIALALFVILSAGSLYIAARVKTQVKELFRMNMELQEEGYYMAEFEFKMLGIAYLLDKGHYFASFSKINQLRRQLKTRAGLVKMPRFKNKEEELEFYLDLQNPHTGAFMDESYPYCAYTGPTGNVLDHLDALARETGRPLKLKYPLKYLDQINTPEKLTGYLDDVSTVGWLADKFPQTSFHFARDVLSLYHEADVVEKYNLYAMSPEWKRTLLQWFFDHQDPQTGLWGPRKKNGELRRKDTMNTASILKAFVDEDGNNIHEEFPLRYKDQMARTFLAQSGGPVPRDGELDRWHEWNLDTSKSIRTFTRYLWDGLSDETRARVIHLAENYIRINFEKFYVEEEGGFSFYPGARHATLDGASGIIGTFKDLGAFSGAKQKRLWGGPEQTITDLGTQKVSSLTANALSAIASRKDVNSLRIYFTPDYEALDANVFAIVYPPGSSALDIMDLVSKMKRWINATPQTMGNWVSKEAIMKELDSAAFEPVAAYKNQIPAKIIGPRLKGEGRVTVIGFDILQVPRSKIVYQYSLQPRPD